MKKPAFNQGMPMHRNSKPLAIAIQPGLCQIGRKPVCRNTFIFFIFALKERLRVLVRTTPMGRF